MFAVEFVARKAEHREQRDEKGDDAFGSLVLVHCVELKSISAAGRRKIVEGKPETVGAQKPFEGLPHTGHVSAIAGSVVGGAKREHECRCVDRLLISDCAFTSANVPARVPDQLKVPVGEADLLKERQAVACHAQRRLVTGALRKREERQWKQRILICQIGLEPAPRLVGLFREASLSSSSLRR